MISGENAHFELVRCADDAEWLARRREGVGGSDVAAIMGVSPWKTPAQLWMEKTGRTEPEDISENPYVKFGTIMEPIIGDWYAERHPDRIVRRVNAICRSIERPHALASLDYEVRCGLVWGVLEIKTARSAADWREGVPAYYLSQVIHYMQVTGRPFADVAVFFRDTCEFAEYRVEYDPEDGEAVRSSVDEFWNAYVLADAMPELAGTDGEMASLTGWHSCAYEFVQEESAEIDAYISDYQDAAAREKAAKADKTAAATHLAARIGDAKGIVTDVARVTWVRSAAERFDTKRFKADHPDLWGEYASSYTKNGGLRIKELA